MGRAAAGWFVLLSSVAEAAGVQERTAARAERFEALRRAFERASGGGAASDEERMQVIARVFHHRNRIALELVELAEEASDDPIALDALTTAVWQVNTTPWPIEVAGEDPARGRAFALLQRDHLRSDRLGPLCQRVSSGFCGEYETFLRAVLDENPHDAVRAQACVALAHFLKNRRQRIDLVDEQPELAREFEGLYGVEYLAALRGQERAQADAEAAALYERAAADHGDVKLPGGGTVGEQARAGLFELRHLSVGKAAPDLEGEDQEGIRFKLSDYRGKVVLIDFWHQY